MIIRRLESSQQLITQPHHATLAAHIMREWQSDHFPDSTRKPSILRAIEHHDDGWEEIDRTLIVDASTGQLLDFMEVTDGVKRETSSLGVERLVSDPYAAALVAQHRLHVYRRYGEQAPWRPFFASMIAARDHHLRVAGDASVDVLLRDYRFVRAGDLASLAFCNNWAKTDADGSGYEMVVEGSLLCISPDPFGGRTVEIEIEAREIGHQRFASPAEARRVLAVAPAVVLKGYARGAARRNTNGSSIAC